MYLAEIAWVLLEAYRIQGRADMLDGAIRILDRLQRLQKPSGGWTLDLGPDGLEWIDGMKMPGGGYFEYQQEDDLRRTGLGSPGQYIPCWWIFGVL